MAAIPVEKFVMQPLREPKYAMKAVKIIGLAPNTWPASKNVPAKATVWALNEENRNVVRK